MPAVPFLDPAFLPDAPLLNADDAEVVCRYVPRPSPARWGTALGAWGDCLIALGTFRQRVGRGGMIIWSPFPEIARFAKAQPFIDAVYYLKPPEDLTAYRTLYDAICQQEHAPSEWPLEKIKVPRPFVGQHVPSVIPTHIDVELAESRRVYHWHGARLPDSAWAAADHLLHEIARSGQHDLSEGFVVLHPYSINSSGIADHWPHWQTALEYLLVYTPHTYLLTGKGWEVAGEHPRLVNLLGRTSMLTLLALCDRARAVVTTSSALAHYAVIQNLPALVVGNKPLSWPDSYFRRWLTADNIELMLCEDGLASFIQRIHRIF